MIGEKVVEQAIKEATEEKKVKVVGKIEIFILSDGNVTVNGPLKDIPLIMSVFGKALGAIANFTCKEESPIVVPRPGLKV